MMQADKDTTVMTDDGIVIADAMAAILQDGPRQSFLRYSGFLLVSYKHHTFTASKLETSAILQVACFNWHLTGAVVEFDCKYQD